tara:strand:+ start:814 stop:2580 length:1767 start_codon:yes stop_codon:yes gene_type:complete
MTIQNIKIQNVRGIDELLIPDKIRKNKPNILVAPNGFGKTSIATAFKSAIKQTSIKLNKIDRHEHDETKLASLSIDLEEDSSSITLNATEVARSNEIRKEFDILVVSDLRKIKSYTRKMGGFSRAEAKLTIPPIEICNIVRTNENPYKISQLKRDFGDHKELLPNLNTDLFDSYDLVSRSQELLIYIDTLGKPRSLKKSSSIQQKITRFPCTHIDALSNAEPEIEQFAAEFPAAKAALYLITRNTKLDKPKAFLAIWQLLQTAKTARKDLHGYLEWKRYKSLKQSIVENLRCLNTSWKNVQVNETKGKLVITIPEPADISNGQRDVLLLLSMMHIARNSLAKARAIILIDEVFDYLDDANLIVAQYFLSQLINEYKRQGRALYLIILTHLNPAFFKNYVFSNQNTIYLDQGIDYNVALAMKKLLAARSQDSVSDDIKDKISKYLVHYHTDDYDFSSDLSSINGIRPTWGKQGRFQSFIQDEFKKYQDGELYDPLAICAITRRKIEEHAYKQIEHLAESNTFFTTHKTAPKLDWSAKRGADIPESHHLLRIVFDDGLHFGENKNNIVPIVSKLSNPIIKKMIVEAVNRA